MSIEKLPEELLIRIFRMLRDLFRESHLWIVITHVCQGWRQIALNAAELWTYIHSGSVDLIKAFVLRSKRAPLDIRYVSKRHKDGPDAVMGILMPQASRIRSIHLQPLGSANLFMQYSFPEGAPLLKSLELCRTASSWRRDETSTLNAIDIPEICRQGLPELRHLQVFSWPISNLSAVRGIMNPSLRSLKISWPGRRSVNEWVSILTELPFLEALHLENALDSATSALEQETGPVVHLSNLTDLTIIRATPAEATAMLQRIIPAESVGIVVEPYSFSHRPDTSLPHLLEILGERLASRRHSTLLRCPTMLSLEFSESTNYGHYRLTLSGPFQDDDGADNCSGRAFTDTRPILKLNLHEVQLSKDVVATLLCDLLSKTFSLYSLKRLDLDTTYSLDLRRTGLVVPQACRELFPQLTGLRVLSLGAVYLDTDLTQSLGNTGSSSPVSFPVLEVFVIRHPYLEESVNFDLLCQTLQSRKNVGFPISHVHLCGDQSGENVAAKLRSYLRPLATSLCCRVDYCVQLYVPGQDPQRIIQHV